jgi:hypothetical protein
MTILTVAACLLFFSTAAYAYQQHDDPVDNGTDEDTSGDGYTFTHAEDDLWAYAQASVFITDENRNTWAAADAYEVRVAYITDYLDTDPTLTATASNQCVAEADAYWDTENSQYLIVVESSGWASGCGLSLGSYAQAVVVHTDTSDTDSDYFSDTADMSYSGATIYYAHYAEADTYGYVTSDMLFVDGIGDSTTTVVVEPEP